MFALATDYDGTLARHGVVEEATVDALRRLRAAGWRLILITGRRLGELLGVFDHVGLFDRVVAENGGLLYCPATGEDRLLGSPPPRAFVDALRRRGVERLSVGRVVVATWRPFETQVFYAIRDLGIDWRVIFNKDAVMVLPPGVDKATGLRAALEGLRLAPQDVVGVGDAENDQAFLGLCGRSAAVANALPSVKECADLVTGGTHGQGVAELAEMLVEPGPRRFEASIERGSS